MSGRALKRPGVAILVAVGLALSAFAPAAPAGATHGWAHSYSILESTGAITPGTIELTDLTFVDDTTTTLLPFAVTFYGTVYPAGSALVVSTNGNIQFTGDDANGPGGNDGDCLPWPWNSFEATVFAYFSFLTTGYFIGEGVFTAVLGTAPNRQFVIEWRASDIQTASPMNFEIILYEASPVITVIYGDMGVTRHGAKAIVGVQETSTGPFTEHICAVAAAVSGLPPGEQLIADGTRLDFIPAGLHVGAVTEVVGDVAITHLDGSRTTAVVGSLIALGDVIETSSSGAVYILFDDNTELTLQGSTRISVDQFVYDPNAQTGSSFFSILQGAFIYVSGLIGKNNPENVTIETPVGALGIRGTEFILGYDQGTGLGQMDLILGRVAISPTSSDITTEFDAPQTVVFDGFNVLSAEPLSQEHYDQLKQAILSLFDDSPPVDTDSDGIPDSSDNCPAIAEDPDGNQDADGCPESPGNDVAISAFRVPATRAGAAPREIALKIQNRGTAPITAFFEVTGSASYQGCLGATPVIQPSKTYTVADCFVSYPSSGTYQHTARVYLNSEDAGDPDQFADNNLANNLATDTTRAR